MSRTLRAWLVLSRLSNLPTVWTNVLAGTVLAGGLVDHRLAVIVLAVSLMYVGGMVLNDACDVGHDRVHRPTRPIPARLVTRAAALIVAIAQMLIGALLVWWIAVDPRAVWWAVGLAAAIVYYDIRHKRDPVAPVAMGLCRGLIYVVAVSAAGGVLSERVFIGALILTTYVAAFTWTARYWPPIRPYVSWCIAAICLLDAGVLVWAGSPGWAAVAVLGMPLTLLWQRWVPGD